MCPIAYRPGQDRGDTTKDHNWEMSEPKMADSWVRRQTEWMTKTKKLKQMVNVTYNLLQMYSIYSTNI